MSDLETEIEDHDHNNNDEGIVATSTETEPGTQPAVEGGESEKRQKFKELAGKRTSNVLDSLRLLGNLSNPSSYEFTQEDVTKIFAVIRDHVNEAEEQFQPKKQKSTTFVL